ncbi:uncharacterized protein LOC144139638 [Haemaphysalis longicornis]
MILRLALTLVAIASSMAAEEDTFYGFNGYGNVFGGDLGVPGAASYEPLQGAAAEEAPQKAARPTILEKPSRLRLTRPPPVTVLPAAQPGGAVTTYQAGPPAVTLQRPLVLAAPPPPPPAFYAAQPQIVFTRQGVPAGAPSAAFTATKTTVSAAPPAAKTKTVTVTTAGAAVPGAPASGVATAAPGTVTVSRPTAVTYPPAPSYLFQRPAYAYQGAPVGLPAPVQFTYMRPLYQPPLTLQPAPLAPGLAPAPLAPAYQRPLLTYAQGAPQVPLTVSPYGGALTYQRPLAPAPAVYGPAPVAMQFAHPAPFVQAYGAPVAGAPYSLARQVVAPFPGTVALARPQLTYQTAAYAQPALGTVTYAQAPAVQQSQVVKQAK